MKTLKQIAKEESLNKEQFEMLKSILGSYWLDNSEIDDEFVKYTKKLGNGMKILL